MVLQAFVLCFAGLGTLFCRPLCVCFFLQALVLCFRLHFGKDSVTINTAAATVRQLFTSIFERVVMEDGSSAPGE